jgi:serine/threonine-protein kinase RIO1
LQAILVDISAKEQKKVLLATRVSRQLCIKRKKECLMVSFGCWIPASLIGEATPALKETPLSRYVRMTTHPCSMFAERTRMLLFKLCNSVLGQVHGVIKTGKESAVFTATGWDPEGAAALRSQAHSVHAAELAARIEDKIQNDQGDKSVTYTAGTAVASCAIKEAAQDFNSKVMPCLPSTAAFPPFIVVAAGPEQTTAVKIFRSTLNEFKNRGEYVSGDYRFRKATHGRSLTRQNPRKVVKIWAEKEWANLIRMWRAGLPCPQPLVLREHVLVMSWLGDTEGFPAPQMKEIKLSSTKAWAGAYTQVVRLMCGMYHRCHLVHGDLSEFNLLWHEKRVWVIDTAQAVDVSHPSALVFLQRDAQNITRFFARKNVAVLSIEDLLRFIISPTTATDGMVTRVYQQAQQRKQARDGTKQADRLSEESHSTHFAHAAVESRGELDSANAEASINSADYIFGKAGDPVVERLKRVMEGELLSHLAIPCESDLETDHIIPGIHPPAMEAVYAAKKGVSSAAAAAEASAIRAGDKNKMCSQSWSDMAADGSGAAQSFTSEATCVDSST